ncbi:MAG: GIN domain-containing protein, partial [Chthoniobacterales bacterium]
EWVKPLQGTHGITVNVSGAALSHVTLNGAVKLNAANLAGTEFYLDGNGATRATLTGKVNAMSSDLNGASRLDAEELTTRAMELSIAGAGRADVNVTDALKVDISGAGKVTYSGNPTVSKQISGAGSVSKRD